MMFCSFFFNDTPTTEIYTYLHTLSLHDALPIFALDRRRVYILPTAFGWFFLLLLLAMLAGALNYNINPALLLALLLAGAANTSLFAAHLQQIGRAHV